MPDKYEKTNDHLIGQFDINRRSHAREVLTVVLPGSRGTSPARHARSRRAGVDSNVGVKSRVSGGGSPAAVKKEMTQVRSESPIITEGGEVSIPGEDEFNLIFDSVGKLSRDSDNIPVNNHSKLVDAFSRAVEVTYVKPSNENNVRKASSHHPATSEGKRAGANHLFKADRSKIVPDYITRPGGSGHSNYSSTRIDKSADLQKQVADVGMGRRRRDRTGRGNRRQQPRLENGSSLVDDSTLGSAAQATTIKYLPNYIQPVEEAARQPTKTLEFDSYQHRRQFPVQSTARAGGRGARRSFVDRQEAKLGDNRLSSSSSSDDSSVEETLTRLPTKETKIVQDISDADSEVSLPTRRRRLRNRARTNQQRPNHTPDYITKTPPRKFSDHGVGRADISSQLADRLNAVNDRGSANKPSGDYMGKQYISREKRPSFDASDKTSVLSHRPTNLHSSVSEQAGFGIHSKRYETSVRKANGKLNEDLNRDAPGKLIIGGTQIPGSLEGVDKKDISARINSSNQSESKPVSDVASQSKVISSSRIDESDTAAGSKAAIEKPDALQHKTKPVGDLRSLFNSAEQPKTKFGQVFNSHKAKDQENLQTDEAKPAKETLNETSDLTEHEQVVHSQPMLKARKVSEDYWPRDEVTEKLLNHSNHTSAAGGIAKSSLEPVCEAEAVIDSTGDMQSMADSLLHEQNLVTVMHIPKETNLSDPQVLSSEPIFVKRSQNDASKQETLEAESRVASNFDRTSEPSTAETAKQTSTSVNQASTNNAEIAKDSPSSNTIYRKHSRSQSTDSTVSNPDSYTTLTRQVVQRKAAPGPVWSFEETDRKLKQYDKPSASDVAFYKPAVFHDNSPSSNIAATESELNDLTPSLRDISINGSPLYIAPKYNNQSTSMTRSRQTLESQDSPPRVDAVRHAVTTSPITSSVSNNSPTISTSSRKSSVVSLSTALPRKCSSTCSPPPLTAVEIDEGCFTEEDNTKSGGTMPFVHPQFEIGNDRILDKGDYENASTKARMRWTFEDSTRNGPGGCNGCESNLEDQDKSMGNDEDRTVDGKFTVGPSKPESDETAPDRNSVSDLSIFSENASLPDDSSDKIIEESSEVNERETPSIKGSGKTLKKKSFSDPNAIAVITAGLMGINPDLENTTLYNSSSEPALSEQTDELGELNQFRIYQTTKLTKEASPQATGIGEMTHSIEEMSKLLLSDHLVMSPRTARRNVTLKSRKRAQMEYLKTKEPQDTNKLVPNDLHVTLPASIDPTVANIFEKEEEQFQQMYESMTTPVEKAPVVHIRSCSAPVDSMETHLVRKASERGRRAGIVQAPSLSDVIKDNRIQEPPDSPLKHTKKLSNSVDRIHAATLPRAVGTRPLGFQVDNLDMRKHVVRNLLETEESYVNSLRILYETYYKPLKRPENHVVCEPRLVDEMFFQIPQILQHHEKFFENVHDCFENWDPEFVKIGEVFIQSFNKDMLLESYTSYIKNFLNAREAVTIATQAKSAFKLFLEQCQRENRDKQGLSDLMIKPVQRIPRYELIIKDLLKHTSEEHADRASLLIAQREIHALSMQMNKGEKEAEAAERHARLLQDIEQIIEGCMGISGITKRRFLHQDICIELKSGNKKDRSLWLFSDLLMCTTSKKGRSGSLRRSSMNLWSMTSDRVMVDFSNKYKFLWKFPLEDVELLKGSTGPNRQATEKQLQQLRSDHETLTQMEKLSTEISTSHLLLDEALKDLLIQTSQKINEKQQMTLHGIGPPGRLEIGISTPDGMKMFQFEFPSEDNKTQFEVLFWSAKKNFSPQKSRWDPAFMKAIPISKTRNGMQFSCSAPNVETSPGTREVWVCNTDGYVGQICFLSIEPETLPTQCITVCNSKICCIAQVPAWDRRLIPTNTFVNEIAKAPLIQLPPGRRRSSTHSNPAHKIIAWDDTDESDEGNTSPISTNSNYSNYSMSPYSTTNSISNFDISSGTTGDGSFYEHGGRVPTNSLMHALLGSGAWKKDSDGSTLHGSLEDLLSDTTSPIIKHPPLAGKYSMGGKALANHGSMWLGTEDGKIKVYSTAESIKGNKQCVQLTHNASVHCILHHDGQVFVALSNGDLIIYFRDLVTGQWDFDNKKSISLGTSPNPITKMLVVNEKELWCGCQNQIIILDMKSHNVKSFFPASQDNKRQIFCMESCGFGVWVALDRRSQIKLYHSVTHDLLTDVDVSQPVSKMLASCDAIIRQHKAACLRITALMVCKDLLWVGTSAGVVLTMALPNITASTSLLSLPIIPQGLPYGHTGHVRFITSVDATERDTHPTRGSRRSSSSKRRSSSTSTSSQTRANTIIISGGDGYEDFRMSSGSEAAGREDSTNHLLLWKT